MMVYEMKVQDVMTREVITVRPDQPMSSLREVLRHNRISGLPVVLENRLVGLISLDDFIGWLAEQQKDCLVTERMSQKLEIMYDDDPLVVAIGKLDRTGMGRLPVVDRQSKALVGILTKGDVIRGLLRKLEIDYEEERLRHHYAGQILKEIQADQTALFFQYNVPGQDFKRAGTGSSRLKRTLKSLGVRPDIVRRIAIASYEAEMNLVVFTPGGKISARVQPDRIVLEVKDGGPGIENVDEAMQPGYSTAPEWVRELGFGAGMGLPNIKKSSDGFEISSQPGKGTRLKASFLLREQRDEAE
ncbi:MAG: CBS domain-containing protein [Planctomycetes bacterium]|nr:CBS domain-containing protein [Planctomycetota bacterium]